ncbi:MAG: aminoglycoside phosphotransferase [Pseudonocardiales bacterium]|nr:aminoglycoside phosphotransferase [Pseudonocardiales bacterium]
MSGAPNAENDAHRGWMRAALAKAAAEASAAVVGNVAFGWRDRSLSARVRAESAEFWLHVVTEQEQWGGGDFWTGNTEANTIIGVPKPRVLRAWEWAEGATRLRAELMTLADGQQCSPTPELRSPVELLGTWWRTLRESLRTLALVPTSRTYLTEHEIARRLRVFFGDRADPTVSEWTAAHADLHWANLIASSLVLVNWEGWGIAPAGFDAATLYLHFLLQPATAKQVRAELNELLEHRDGLVSQLYVTTRMLLRIEQGDYPDLAVPLHRNAERVLKRLRGCR